MNLSAIAAIAENFAIGRKGQLLCHIPGDLPRFKSITVGHPIIMGMNTFRSFPNGALPNRHNIVITHHPLDNQIISSSTTLNFVSSLEQALSVAEQFTHKSSTFNSDNQHNHSEEEPETFIIGGGQIYKQSFPLVKQLYLTLIYANFPDADAFFPEFSFDDWMMIFREDHQASPHNPYAYSFTDLRRK